MLADDVYCNTKNLSVGVCHGSRRTLVFVPKSYMLEPWASNQYHETPWSCTYLPDIVGYLKAL